MFKFSKNHFFFNGAVLSLLALMIFNDHYLKEAYPNELTGKTSDICGIFVFPLFLCTIYETLATLLKNEGPLPGFVFYSSLILTNVLLIGLNTSKDFVNFYLEGMDFIGIPSKVTMDGTDLLVLPINFLTIYYIQPWLTRGSRWYRSRLRHQNS